ncbi:MAG TPA: hypothetical protein VHO01_10585 [Jatrophihabitans sp.]|nr:hypothetical protein [Jatrophihabitans sp.]
MAVTAVIVAASVIYLLHLGRRTTFFYDEWSWLTQRRGWRPSAFLASHNGHFVALPVLIYHLLFTTVGARHYLPYRLALMAFHAGTCLCLYFYARRRVDPWLAAVAAGAMCLIGAAYQDLVWPFQMTLMGALCLGMAAWLVLDHEPSRRTDVLALVLLLGAISCSGAGLAMLAGAAVLVACRRQWRRWWLIAVPGLAFLLWYVRYGGDPVQPSSTGHKLRYLADGFRSGVAALTGHPYNRAVGLAATLSVIIALLAVARLLWSLLSERRPPAGLLGAATAALALWGLTAVGRGHFNDYGSSRYMYGAALVVVLLVLECLRGLPAQRLLAAGLAVLTAFAVNTGLGTLRPGTKSLANVDTYVRADLAAVEQLRNPVLGYRINSRFVPTLTVGQYLSVRRDLGSPAMPFAAVPGQPAGVRNDVDRVLRDAGQLMLDPASRPGTHPVTLTADPVLTLPRLRGCVIVRGTLLTVELRLPTGGLVITALEDPATVWVHRFGPTGIRWGSIAAGDSARLSATADDSATPWSVQVRSPGAVELCADGR